MDTTTHALQFDPESLPRSLRHHSIAKALHDAAQLAEFLQTAIATITESKYEMGDNELMGLDQCFCLLRDKIEIGAGLYQFPQMGSPSDHKLCIRREV